MSESSKGDSMCGVGLARLNEMHLVNTAKPELLLSTDVIIQTIVAGVCGSDLHCLRGLEPCDLNTIFGHEVVGTIVHCGADVHSFKVGDVVMTPFTTACGTCHSCMHDMSARCSSASLLGWRLNGKGLQGTQAEYVRIPNADGTVVRLPQDQLHPEEGLLIGDILSTAAFCAMNAGVGANCGSSIRMGTQAGAVGTLRNLLEITRDVDVKCPEGGSETRDVYVVLGCGPVGLLAVMCVFELHELSWKAHSQQKSTTLDFHCPPIVFAVDSIPARLLTAQRVGAIPLNLAELGTDGVLAEVRKTAALGATGVLECVGGAMPLDALALGFALLRNGGTLSAVGVPAPGAPFPFSPADCYDKNITFVIGRCPSRSMMPLSAELLIRAKRKQEHASSRSTRLTLADARTAIITHRLTLAEGPAGYELFNSRAEGCTKVVLYRDEAERGNWVPADAKRPKH